MNASRARTSAAQRLHPAMTSAEAIGQALLGGAAQYEARCAAILDTDDPEAVHGARVALRRMRSTLRGFKDMLSGKQGDRLNEVLAERFRELGPLRDADVQAAALAGKQGQRVGARAAALRREIRDTLARREGRTLTARVSELLADPDRLFTGTRRRRLAAAPVGLMAGRAMQVAWTELLAFGTDLDALSPGELHDFRKRTKDLRYLTELFLPLYPDRDARHMLKLLKSLQDALGVMNDLHVMADKAPDDADRRDEDARDSVRKLWKHLRDSPAWWAETRG